MGRLYHNFRSTTSERDDFTRLQSFVDLQASELAATQVVPTADIRYGCQGGRGIYIRAVRGSLPPRVSDMLAVRIGQLTAEVFHLLDLHPCWLLRRLYHLVLAFLMLETSQMAGPLGSTDITPLRCYYGPGRHPLAFGRLPGVAGYTTTGALGEGFPLPLFRLRGGFTVSPWRTFSDAPL
jgi:hypothetical protein